MPFPFRNGIISIHPKVIRRLPIKQGKETFPSSLVTQPQQQNQHLAHSRKQENTKSFTGKIELRQE